MRVQRVVFGIVSRRRPLGGVRFVQLSHRDALSVAKTETKLLFLYLHAPMHHESEVFCSQVLASPEVSTFVNDNFIAWGGSLRDGDAHALAAEVNPSAYPYVALLDSVSRGGGASLVMSCEVSSTPMVSSVCSRKRSRDRRAS